MSKGLTHLFVVCFSAITLATFFGCGSNIKHIPATTQPVSDSMVYAGSFEKVWVAAQGVLSEEATFKVLDKASGIIVTEPRTIEGKELSIVQTTFLGKTYKSSYTLNIRAIDQKTEVKVNVNLQAVQVGFFSREEDSPDVKSYLRQQLFDKISARLKG